MADIIVDGYTRVYFVPTISNTSAPTVAELDAGDALQGTLVPNGLEGFEASPGEVDNTSFDSTFDTKLPGIASYSGSRLVLKKQTMGTDPVFDALTTFNTAGYIVIRRGIDSDTAWTAAQNCQVYPVRTGTFDFVAPERNTVQKYWVATPISSAPVMTATVAA